MVALPLISPLVSDSTDSSLLARFHMNPVLEIKGSNVVSLFQREIHGRRRCNLYKTGLRVAENRKLTGFWNRDLKLLDLAIKSREQKFKTSKESHLALMSLQNQRSVVENTLLILSNRWSLLEMQAHLQVGTSNVPVNLPVIVSLTAPLFSNPKLLVRDCPQFGILRHSTATESTPQSVVTMFAEELAIEVACLVTEINNLALRYAMFSDELQLRRQESVAAAVVGLEAGRMSVADVVERKRKLLGDEIEMTKIRREQHELLADLVYLSGAPSYEALLHKTP